MNEEIEVRNAKIVSTHLGYEDHGIFIFMLDLKYGKSEGQGAGGYALDEYVGKRGEGHRVGTKVGMDLIIAILKTVGVDRWENLVGQSIRVKAGHAKVYAIGNLFDDSWLDFAEFFKSRPLCGCGAVRTL